MLNWLQEIFKGKNVGDAKKKDSVTGYQLRKEILKTWPGTDINKIFLADKAYVLPTQKELKQILFDSQVDHSMYVAETHDCDDFALLLHAHVIERKSFYDYPLAFGQVWYRTPSQGNHAINLCLTKDKGFLLIEPQTDKTRYPDKDQTILFVRI